MIQTVPICLWARLVEAGLAPPFADPIPMLPAWDRDWLGWLSQFQAGVGQNRTVTRAWRTRLRTIHEQVANGAALTAGFPRVDPDIGPDIDPNGLGLRLVYWPAGIVALRRVGIASSRLGRRWHDRTEWFAALRTIVRSMDSGDCLFSVNGTTSEPMVRRCATVFGVTTMVVHVDLVSPLRKWWQRMTRVPATIDSQCLEVYVSPRLSPASTTPDDPELIPARDEGLATWSDIVEAIHVRRAGIWDRLLRRRLKDERFRAETIRIFSDPQLIAGDLRAEFVSRGAVLHSEPAEVRHRDGDARPEVTAEIATGQLVRSENVAATGNAALPPLDPCCLELEGRGDVLPPWEYLIHWTRAPRARWSDESNAAYIDGLLRGENAGPRTALDTLRRILSARRICGSAKLIRGGYRVVSLSAASIDQLRRQRVFRRHLGRYDFEPYGFCLRREIVERVGGRPVRYGADVDWPEINSYDRPFFQRARSGRLSTLDWSIEREWRLLGDLDLARFSPDDLRVFVACSAEADLIRGSSPWPVIALSDVD